MRPSIRFVTATGLASALKLALAATPTTDPVAVPEFTTPFSLLQSSVPQWRATGGEIAFRFNRDMLVEFGLEVVGKSDANQDGEYLTFRAESREGLRFAVPRRSLEHFTEGSLHARGGFVLRHSGGSIDLRSFSLQVDPSESARLTLLDSRGQVWLYADNVMYEGIADASTLRMPTMDLRIGPALARSIGVAEAQGMAIADMRIEAPIVERVALPAAPKSCANPNWPGTLGYEADVLMEFMSTQQMRCRGIGNPAMTCDGVAGDDGQVIFAPSSHLRNSNDNNNNGLEGACSAANPCTADVPWYQKFSGNRPPYGNDQHPFLIWNMYRVDALGRIDQVGRSGVKHAFNTTNQNCADATCIETGAILGLNCSDTYSTGNNDTNNFQGPRSEIIPGTGQWGRCGSIYDDDCNNMQGASGLTNWDQRMIVRESQIEAVSNPQAQYYFQSWYIVRDDVNIYNTMGTLRVTPSFESVWSLPPTGGMTVGPALSRWVDPVNPGSNASNIELASAEGHARVAVRVQSIGGGLRRYNYAVENFDFARAVTEGAEPSLRVVRNLGFNSFSVPVAADSVTDLWFSDGDLNPANDWTAAVAGGRVTWMAPAGNALNWGTLFGFSFVADGGARTADTSLGVAEAGSPPDYAVAALAPGQSSLFVDSFE